MQTIHIQRRLDSETLPELKPWIGKTVEITNVERPVQLHTTEQDWEEFFAWAGTDLADPEQVREVRKIDQERNVAPEL